MSELSWLRYVHVSGVDLLLCDLENITGSVVCISALTFHTAASLSQKIQNKKFLIYLFDWCLKLNFEKLEILTLKNSLLKLRKPSHSNLTHFVTHLFCHIYATTTLLVSEYLAPLIVILFLLYWPGANPGAENVFTEFLLIIMSRKIFSKFLQNQIAY